MTDGIIQLVINEQIRKLALHAHKTMDITAVIENYQNTRQALIERIRKEFQCNYSYDGKCNALRQLIGDST